MSEENTENYEILSELIKIKVLMIVKNCIASVRENYVQSTEEPTDYEILNNDHSHPPVLGSTKHNEGENDVF